MSVGSEYHFRSPLPQEAPLARRDRGFRAWRVWSRASHDAGMAPSSRKGGLARGVGDLAEGRSARGAARLGAALAAAQSVACGLAFANGIKGHVICRESVGKAVGAT